MAVVTSNSVLCRGLLTNSVTQFGLKSEVSGAKVVPWRAIGSGGKMKGGFRVEVKAAVQIGGLEQVKKAKEELGIDAVSEGELREKGFLGMRKKKACLHHRAGLLFTDLEKLALGGMNVARLNMCHKTRDWHLDVIKKIKKLNEEKVFCVLIMIDNEGSQIHVLDHGAPSVKAEEGCIWLLTTQKLEYYPPFTVQASYDGFLDGIEVGDVLVIDGGMASF
ncbi:UDP-glycosyltransferase 74F2-like [Hibiscus syriacus]|uniref:pyruvate kinase n=1 Tax=Hibiscus syriacus TaxID=106335 RepID=A0A6A2X961_HIBSY|nr:UDP-glycosyltransferase 74F2-like [Hibiscus syriacus]